METTYVMYMNCSFKIQESLWKPLMSLHELFSAYFQKHYMLAYENYL